MTQSIPQLLDGKGSLSPLLIRNHLEENGFGQFMTSTDRTLKTFFFRKVGGVLKNYSATNIRTWLIKDVQDHYTEERQDEVLTLVDKLARMPDGTLESSVLYFLQRFGEEETEDCVDLIVARDTKDKCFVRFQNGIVEITKDNIQLLPYDSDQSDSVWEQSIIRREIEIQTNNDVGLFEKFALNAMRVEDRSIEPIDGDWTKSFPITESVKKNFESLRSAIGYLIHGHNSVQKCVIFIDRAATFIGENGGNGKTLVMKSLEHFRGRLSINGKQFYRDGGSRFAFSGVQPSTGLIHIDDVPNSFDFKDLFSFITGDLEVEGKGTNKIIIPESKKPKFGITTNYVLGGNNASHERRQHWVEFGDYWRRSFIENEEVWDPKHLGKSLFSEFDEKDWNQFYNFGFKCVQLYLREGLLKGAGGSFSEKKIASEAADDNPDIADWMLKYCSTDRLALDHHKSGVFKAHLYKMFVSELGSRVARDWDETRFSKAMFQYVSQSSDYEWNPQKSGSTLTDKRHLKTDEYGVQSYWIKIVGSTDNVSTSPIVSESSNDDAYEDSMSYFKEMLKDA